MVSIIIRTFNRLQLLKEAIESVRAQTMKDYEIIVLDGGSSDGTMDFLSYEKDLIKVSRENKNYIGALNEGIKAANGEYIAFLDDDDIWAPEFLERSLDFFGKDEELSIVCSDYSYFFGEDKKNRYSLRKKPSKSDILYDLIPANLIPINTALIKKKLFYELGFFDEALDSHEEWDLWLRAAISGVKFGFVEDKLALIRKHEKRVTSNQLRMFEGAKRVLEKNLPLIPLGKDYDFARKNISRLSFICAVLKICNGKRQAGLKDFIALIGAGKLWVLVMLPLALLPARVLSFAISVYGRQLIKPENI